MSIINASTPSQISSAIANAAPGVTIKIAPGKYNIERIHRVDDSGTAKNPIIIEGSGIRETTLYTKNGRCFRLCGNYIILRNLTVSGGGDPIEVIGDNIIIDNISTENNNIGIKVSGLNAVIHNSFIYSNEKEGIEVNGGFIYRPDWGIREPIRVREAIGLVPKYSDQQNAENRAKWSAEQLAEMDALWGNNNMNCLIENCFLHDNGYNRYPNTHPDGWLFGQAMYGGAIKAVPNVAGLTVRKCFVYKNGFSAYWIDWGSEGENVFEECVAIDAHHGVHIEGGVTDTPNQKTTVRNCIFWNVHQGIFNSASQKNLYENNIINSFQYGLVNHGVKGERANRKSIAEWKNNHVYMTPFTRTRIVGQPVDEKPKAHFIWFTGPNANGSTRSGNVYHLTPDFSDLVIAKTSEEGYSLNNRDNLANGETTVLESEAPKLNLPSWVNGLPLVSEYFNEDYDTSDPVIDDPVIDDPIVDDPVIDDPVTDPPQTGGRKRCVITTDLDNAPDWDDWEALAIALTYQDYAKIEKIIIASKKQPDNGALAEFNRVFRPAYKAAAPALNAAYGNYFPLDLDVMVASSNGEGFIDQDIDLSKYPSTKAIIDLISPDDVLDVHWWGSAGECANVAKWIEDNNPSLMANVRFISHAASLITHHNYRTDKPAAQYIKSIGAKYNNYLSCGFVGKTIDGKHSYPLVKINDHGTELGKLTHYKYTKIQNGPKTDGSDSITFFAAYVDKFGGGEDYIQILDWSGKGNEAVMMSHFKEIRPQMFPDISSRFKAIADFDGVVDDPVIDDPVIDDPINDPPVSQLAQRLSNSIITLEMKMDEMQTAIEGLKGILTDMT